MSTADVICPAIRYASISGTPGPGVRPPHAAHWPQDRRQQAKPAQGCHCLDSGAGSTCHPSGLGCSPKTALLQSGPKVRQVLVAKGDLGKASCLCTCLF